MKIQVKGIVRTVSGVTSKTSSDQKTTNSQSLIITVPGYVDAFGDKKSEDESWEFQLFNEAIIKHDLLSKDLQSKKVIVDGYLNSRAYKANGEEKYALGLRFAGLEIYNK